MKPPASFSRGVSSVLSSPPELPGWSLTQIWGGEEEGEEEICKCFRGNKKDFFLCVFRREKNGGFLLQRREAWLVEKLVVEAVASA